MSLGIWAAGELVSVVRMGMQRNHISRQFCHFSSLFYLPCLSRNLTERFSVACLHDCAVSRQKPVSTSCQTFRQTFTKLCYSRINKVWNNLLITVSLDLKINKNRFLKALRKIFFYIFLRMQWLRTKQSLQVQSIICAFLCFILLLKCETLHLFPHIFY